MIRKVGNRAYDVYALDFETHNDPETKEKRETSIWLSCLLNETSDWKLGNCFDYTIEELMTRLDRLSKKHSLLIYVYNLSFEWSFILPVILKMGYEWSAKLETGDEKKFTSVTTKTASSVWSVGIQISPKHHRIVFRDLAKMFPGGLANIAREMGLETQKGKIDYELNRLHGYVVTEEEKEYCFNDCKIVFEILQKMDELDDRDFWKCVSSASYATSKMIRTGFPRARDPYRVYRKYYPLLDKTESDYLRNGVSGGIAYIRDCYMFKDIKKRIIHIDAHQMHPSSAYLNYFPMGRGKFRKGQPKNPFKIQLCRCLISYRGVKLHSAIELIGIDFIDDYEIYLWNFEIPTFQKCYMNLKIKYLDYYEYDTQKLPWREFYKKNYEERNEEKAKGHGFLALLRKLWNNSSYGKLIEHGHDKWLRNYITHDGLIDSEEIDRDDADINAKYTYIPGGACIPAYSRVRLIETAYALGWENVIYFDTDSIFAIDCKEVRDGLKTLNMNNELGGWARENDIERGQWTAPKRYKIMEEEDGFQKLVVHTAGFQLIKEDDDGSYYIPYKESDKRFQDASSIPYDEINITTEDYRVQRAYRVKGGTIIDFINKKIQVQTKYERYYNGNVGESSVLPSPPTKKSAPSS